MTIVVQDAVEYPDDDVFVQVELHAHELKDVDLTIEALESLEMFSGKQQSLFYWRTKEGADSLAEWLMQFWEYSFTRMLTYGHAIAELQCVFEGVPCDESTRVGILAGVLLRAHTASSVR